MTNGNEQEMRKGSGSIKVILTGNKLSTKVDPLVDMVLDKIPDKANTVRIRIDETDGKEVLLHDIESSIITVQSHLGEDDVLVLDVDLPKLNTTGEVFDSWNRFISSINEKLDSGLRMILILTTVNSYLYPNEFRYRTNMIYKVDHPSKLYTIMLEPALTDDEDSDVVAYDVINCKTYRIDLDGHYTHDDVATENEEYEREFRDAELKVVALGLGMAALSLVVGVVRLIARINANRS